MIRAKDDRFSGFRVQAQKAADDLVRFQNLNGTQLVIYRNVQAFCVLLQPLCHVFRRQRSSRACSGKAVVIGLIADIFSIAVCREGNAQLTQMQKAASRKCRFAKRLIAVYTAAGEKVLCHLPYAVCLCAAKRQLIVGLLVAADIA